MNNLERKKALQRELERRQAKKSTSERQAAVIADADERDERDDERDHGVWGVDERERPELPGDATSRRQAARITRGRSS